MLENHHLKITILEDHLSKLLFFITRREISIKNLIFFFCLPADNLPFYLKKLNQIF